MATKATTTAAGAGTDAGAGAGAGAGAAAVPAVPAVPCNLVVSKTPLHVVAASDLAAALQRGLAPFFTHVEVTLTACPDLRGTEGDYGWGLARAGLGAATAGVVLDLGKVDNLLDPAHHWRSYDLEKALDESGLGSRPFVIGAGAAVSQYVGCTAEAMPNVWLGPCRKFGSKYAAVCDDGTIRQGDYPGTCFGLFQNLLATNGDTADVLRIKVKGRKTEANFHDSIKQALEAEFPDKNMGLGGVFRLRGADMHIHVMDYVPTEPATQDDLIGRLKRFEVPAGDLTNMTTIVTNTSEGSLRPKNNPHTHCFGTKEGVVGGHYHWDMDADAAEYEGFFVLAHTFVVAEQEKASA